MIYMSSNGKAKSLAPKIMQKYKSLKKTTRQPSSRVRAKSPEIISAKKALNNMVENYSFLTPSNKKRVMTNLVNAIKKMR